MHILAVSGSNVAFVAAPALMLFIRAGARRALASGLTILVVVFYVFMTGASASVVRAGVMAVLMLGADVLGRDRDVFTSLAVAALFLLIGNPLALFDAGFQLSFVATLGILFLVSKLEPVLEHLPRFLKEPLGVTAAAQFAVTPIGLYYFSGFSFISVVANLFVVPLVGLLVTVGTLGTLAGLILMPIARIIGYADWALLTVLIKGVGWLSVLPYAYVYFPTPSPAWILGYYGFLVWVFDLWRPSWLPGPRLWRKKHVMIAALLASTAVVWWRVADPPGRMKVVFLDVGQGDAIFVRFPGGKTMLVDGGGQPEYDSRGRPESDGGRQGEYDTGRQAGSNTGGGFDPGERIVVPFLRRQGVRRIDYLVLSHPHGDHAGGLPTVTRAFPVGLALDSGQPHTFPGYRDWLGLLRDKGVPYRIARAGLAWKPSPGVLVEVLSPPPGGASPGGASPRYAAPEELLHGTRSDLNSNSVVLRISYGRVSFLLAGDIERETEEGLLRNVPDKLRSTVLKVAHHGSKYSTGERFLEAVCPDYAVVQVGRNSFGHPDAQTLARLKGFGAKTMVTLADGAVTAITDGSDLRVATVRVGK